uniref:Uncharacterized protein n=1 Tax=Rhizophora mucronata TaxID=61149 RepID=A0A2P2QA75_RHIMU
MFLRVVMVRNFLIAGLWCR